MGDDLTPDHIPSYAALKKAKEAQLGRNLRLAEAKALYEEANAMMVRTRVHKAGRTFGGKNTPRRIAQDAADLGKAAEADVVRHQQTGASTAAEKARKAAEELDKLNRKQGTN